MLNIDYVEEFIRGFFTAEYAALVAVYSEPDDDIVAQLEQKAMTYLHVEPGHIMSLGFGRPPGLSPEEVAKDADYVSELQERVLFLIIRYQRQEGNDLYGCFVSSTQKLSGLAYASCFYVTAIDGEAKIIAHYTPGLYSPEESLTWRRLDGSTIDNPGHPVEARKFVPPTMPAHLEHYNAA